MSESMTDEEFMGVRRALMRAAVDVEGLDLERFLERVARAEQGSPDSDALLCGRGTLPLAALRKLAEAGGLMKEAYYADPRASMAAVLDAYGRDDLAKAGIV